MDKLKELSAKLDGNIRPQRLFNANFEEASFRKLIVKDYKQYKVIIDEYRDLYSIRIKVNSNLSCSINKPDKIFLYNKPKSFPDLSYKVYVSNEKYDFFQNDQLKKFWGPLVILLQKLRLSTEESVFLYNNYIYFALTAQRDIALILDDIIDLINSSDGIFNGKIKKSISSQNIPENLKSLIPLLKKYSVSDDANRAELIEEMGEKEKLKLIKLVQSFFEEITIYLDSFKDMPLSEEAILIGNLAELVSELKLK